MTPTASTHQSLPAEIRDPTRHDNPSHEQHGEHEEHQYLSIIRTILNEGELRADGTGTDILSVFAPPRLRFSLSKPGPTPCSDRIPILPLFTTKRVFKRAVIAELLWYISGCTSSIPLSEAGIKIWDRNASRENLDRLGFSHYETGDLGPLYGFQWRHFGAEYINAQTDYTGQGVDQLAEVMRKIKEEPLDIRIILGSWNPPDLKKMTIQPCHLVAQFFVSYPDGVGRKGTLSSQVYQGSCDMGLGLPFNIASYALLTHMLAHAADLHPGTLTHNLGDAHVYVDHVDPLKEQLQRVPTEFPELHINRGDRGSGVIDGWNVEDLDVINYQPHKSIKMNMTI